MLAKIFEVIMLICFGFSWPFNLIKSIKTRSTKGKSLLFLILIDMGYVFGICSKLVSTTFNWSSDWWVFMIYVINLLMVSADMVMYFINKHHEKSNIAYA